MSIYNCQRLETIRGQTRHSLLRLSARIELRHLSAKLLGRTASEFSTMKLISLMFVTLGRREEQQPSDEQSNQHRQSTSVMKFHQPRAEKQTWKTRKTTVASPDSIGYAARDYAQYLIDRRSRTAAKRRVYEFIEQTAILERSKLALKKWQISKN